MSMDMEEKLPEIDAESFKQAVWELIAEHQGRVFLTAKKLEFTYVVRGREVFVSRKGKSITRSTVDVAVDRVISLGGLVSGPKKLGVFGASYLYPVFLALGVARRDESTRDRNN